MKKLITFLIAIFTILGSAYAQRSIQFHKNGEVKSSYNIADIDSIIFAKKHFIVNLSNQWRQSNDISNPDPTLYDGVYESNSNYNVNNSTSTMSITINGYTEFTIYVRSYGESKFDYVTVSELDSPNSVKYSAKGEANSGTTLSSYTPVTFTGIDGGLHTITIKYSKDDSGHSGTDRGYILIPKTGTLPSGKGIEKGHEYVDLGLSVKWATCNVGANTPEEYGEYYAWGETEPKDYYDSSTYKYNGSETTLDLENDAANINWGGKWRMPTLAELKELTNTSNCTWTWTTQNGVKGYKVTSVKNGNSIFLPAVGSRKLDGLISYDSHGLYWTSSLNTNNTFYKYAYDLSFDENNVKVSQRSWTYSDCYLGMPVRAVLE